EPDACICWKAVMMPMTVPRRPMNGAVELTVARMLRPRLLVADSRAAWRSRARATDSKIRSLLAIFCEVAYAPRPDVITRPRSPMALPSLALAAPSRSPLASSAPIFVAKARASRRAFMKRTRRSPAITTVTTDMMAITKMMPRANKPMWAQMSAIVNCMIFLRRLGARFSVRDGQVREATLLQLELEGKQVVDVDRRPVERDRRVPLRRHTV